MFFDYFPPFFFPKDPTILYTGSLPEKFVSNKNDVVVVLVVVVMVVVVVVVVGCCCCCCYLIIIFNIDD